MSFTSTCLDASLILGAFSSYNIVLVAVITNYKVHSLSMCLVGQNNLLASFTHILYNEFSWPAVKMTRLISLQTNLDLSIDFRSKQKCVSSTKDLSIDFRSKQKCVSSTKAK